MIGALLVLLPMAGVVTWVFLRFSPVHAHRQALLRFNLASVSVALILAVAWGVRTYRVMSPTADSAWWPVIAGLGALIIVPAVLGAAAILRNLVVFRRGAQCSRR